MGILLLLISILLLLAGGILWIITQHHETAVAVTRRSPDWLAAVPWGLPALGCGLLLVSVMILVGCRDRCGTWPAVRVEPEPILAWPLPQQAEATAIPVSAPPGGTR